MKIPKTLKVGGFRYKIIKKRLTKENSGYSGIAKHNQTIIELGSTYKDEAYDIQKIEECLMHEIIHCVDCIYNNQKLDEDVVDRLSQGLYQVLKDNKFLKE